MLMTPWSLTCIFFLVLLARLPSAPQPNPVGLEFHATLHSLIHAPHFLPPPRLFNLKPLAPKSLSLSFSSTRGREGYDDEDLAEMPGGLARKCRLGSTVTEKLEMREVHP